MLAENWEALLELLEELELERWMRSRTSQEYRDSLLERPMSYVRHGPRPMGYDSWLLQLSHQEAAAVDGSMF
ncbi:hypothetical protein FOZ61_009942 [Perkinsus olseni]|uniref:Uncharacterized protein n=1 Tax=Perkinsus olseni TaxID=32597 RepID=A0A7J6KXK8_PEROL|nr:hypothetical protein FOZ61_009942 [Perkinsus olseni]